jgi:hypothetical protein
LVVPAAASTPQLAEAEDGGRDHVIAIPPNANASAQPVGRSVSAAAPPLEPDMPGSVLPLTHARTDPHTQTQAHTHAHTHTHTHIGDTSTPERGARYSRAHRLVRPQCTGACAGSAAAGRGGWGGSEGAGFSFAEGARARREQAARCQGSVWGLQRRCDR